MPELLPRISQEEFDDVEKRIETNEVTPEQAQQAVAGDGKEIYVDNLETPVAALGKVTISHLLSNPTHHETVDGYNYKDHSA